MLLVYLVNILPELLYIVLTLLQLYMVHNQFLLLLLLALNFIFKIVQKSRFTLPQISQNKKQTLQITPRQKQLAHSIQIQFIFLPIPLRTLNILYIDLLLEQNHQRILLKLQVPIIIIIHNIIRNITPRPHPIINIIIILRSRLNTIGVQSLRRYRHPRIPILLILSQILLNHLHTQLLTVHNTVIIPFFNILQIIIKRKNLPIRYKLLKLLNLIIFRNQFLLHKVYKTPKLHRILVIQWKHLILNIVKQFLTILLRLLNLPLRDLKTLSNLLSSIVLIHTYIHKSSNHRINLILKPLLPRRKLRNITQKFISLITIKIQRRYHIMHLPLTTSPCKIDHLNLQLLTVIFVNLLQNDVRWLDIPVKILLII